jgi:hypothetical protein
MSARETNRISWFLNFIQTWYWIVQPILSMVLMIVVYPSALAEDAYIILRYAENISKGHGFVWNPGEAPVWGSTSFLWTILLGGIGTLGVDLVLIAQGLNIAIAIMIILTMGWFSVSHLKASRTSTLFALLIFSISPIVGHILTGFDVLLFSLSLLLCYIFSYFSMQTSQDTRRNQILLGLTLVITSISRPEGMIAAGVALVVILLARKTENLKSRIIHTLIPYGAIMGAFLLGTFLYFGSVVPNPLLIKSSGISIVEASIRRGLSFLTSDVTVLVIVLCVIWLVSLESVDLWKQILLFLPILTVYGSYFFIIQYQNILLRFQFPVLPLLFLLMPSGIELIRRGAGKDVRLQFWKDNNPIGGVAKLGLVVGVLGIVLLAQFGVTRTFVPYSEGVDKLAVGDYLNQYSEFDYTLVVTEAGMLPYSSGWRVIDAWGLNDPHIAAEGLDDSYLLLNDPEVIQFHDVYNNNSVEWETSTVLWSIMTLHLWNFAVTNNYTLAAIINYSITQGGISSPTSYQWYFVHPDFPHSSEIIDGLRSLPSVEYTYGPTPP